MLESESEPIHIFMWVLGHHRLYLTSLFKNI
jgi:hypothetical protein